MQHTLASKDVPVESNRQSHWTQNDGNDFDHTHEEKHRRHHKSHDAFQPPFGTKGVNQKTPHTDFFNREIEPDQKG